MGDNGPKDLIRLCPACGSGDVGWDSVSVRPYCRECHYWPPPHHGTEQEMVNMWNNRLRDLGMVEATMELRPFPNMSKEELISYIERLGPPSSHRHEWIPGIPAEPEPNRLYAVMGQPDSGYGVGIVIRGADCNWRSNGIIAHYPLPLTMTQAEAMRLKRKGEYDLEP